MVLNSMPHRWFLLLTVAQILVGINAFVPNAVRGVPGTQLQAMTFSTTSRFRHVSNLPRSGHLFSTGRMASISSDEELGDVAESVKEDSLETSKLVAIGSSKVTRWQKLKEYFSPPDDGLTFKQRLGKMGLAAVLSYGWVSNMSYSVSVSLAWYIFSKRTGLSPLAPGQWKGFLAVYAGFWVFNNIVRPIRLGIAVAISPQFDRVVSSIQRRLNVSKAVAVTVTVVLANVVGTLLAMSGGIFVASICAGVPVWATGPK